MSSVCKFNHYLELFAAETNNVMILRILRSAGMKLDARTPAGFTLGLFAACYDAYSVITYLNQHTRFRPKQLACMLRYADYNKHEKTGRVLRCILTTKQFTIPSADLCRLLASPA